MATYNKSYFSKDVEQVVTSRTISIQDRYDTKVRLRLNDGNVIVRNLKKDDLVAPETKTDLVHTVTVTEDKRPDLIANTFYGDARLYWIILAANGLREKEEIRKGMIIRVPSKTAVYGSKGILS